MIEQQYVTRAEWKKHVQSDWKKSHNLWSHIKDFVPGWGYSSAEIDAFFEGESGGKKQVHWDRITNKPSTFAPSVHASAHMAAGGDPIRLDELKAPTDVTTLDASQSAHGLMMKYPGGTTNYLREDGTWTAPTPGAHDIITTHTDSGLTVGYVIRASGATSFVWAQLSHADLGNLHQSVITSATPTFASLTLDVGDLYLSGNNSEVKITGTGGYLGQFKMSAQSMSLRNYHGTNNTDIVLNASDGGIERLVLQYTGATNYTRIYDPRDAAGNALALASALHAQSHVLSGSDHTASGLTVGHVIRATGASAFAWQQIQWDDVLKTGSSLADLATRTHGNLSDAPDDAHHSKLHVGTHLVGAGDPLSVGTPSNIGTTNAAGSQTNFVRRDHVHAHPSGLGVNLHHSEAHTLTSHSTKAHSELSDAPDDAHHPKLHASTHSNGQPDVVNHDNLAGFLAAEHLSLPNSMANVINSGHDKAAHDALGIDAETLDDINSTSFVRSDQDDVIGCTLRFSAAYQLRFGTSPKIGYIYYHQINNVWNFENKLDPSGGFRFVAYDSGSTERTYVEIMGSVDRVQIRNATNDVAVAYAIITRALDTFGATTDITTGNATTSKHGLCQKLGGGTTNFFRADGSWAVPPLADHASEHEIGGGDLISHDNLTDWAANKHVILPNSMANVINSGHDKAAHDALNIDADTLDGKDLSAAVVNDTVVLRTGAGYVYASQFYSSAGAATGNPSHYWAEFSSNGLLRKITVANFLAYLVADGLMPKSGGAFTGLTTARNHGTASVDELVNVCYGTTTPPAASGTTEGALWVKYVA